MEVSTFTSVRSIRRPVGVLLAVLVVVFSFLLLGSLFSPTKAPTKAAEHFFSVVRTGDLENAYLLVSSDMKDSVSYDGFESFLLSQTPIVNGDRIVFRMKEVEDGYAILSGHATFEELSIPVTIELEDIDGTWFVTFLSTDPVDVP